MKTFFTALFLFLIQIFSVQEEESYANGIFNFEENKHRKYSPTVRESGSLLTQMHKFWILYRPISRY